MKRFLKGLLILLTGMGIELSLTAVRADWGLSYSSVAGFFLFFFAALLCFRNAKEIKPWVIGLLLIIGLSVLHLPPRIVAFEETLVSLPDYISHLLAVVAAWIFYTVHSAKKWIAPVMSVLLVGFLFFKGYGMWLHKLNFGTYTGYFRSSLPVFNAVLSDGTNIRKETFSNKLVLIDFWHTQCGACFRKFPLLNELYLQYRDNKNIGIYALNMPLATDKVSQAFDMISQRKYVFPVAKLSSAAIIDSLAITAFPATILVNRYGQVVFKGSLENAGDKLGELLKDIQ